MLNISVLHSFLLLLVFYPVNKQFIHLLREIKEFLVFSLIFVVQLQATLWRYFLYMSPKIEVPTLDYAAGGGWQVNERSFTCIYSCSPSLALPPELCPVSDQGQHSILTGAWTLTLKSRQNILRLLQNRNKEHSKCNVLKSYWNHPPPLVHGKLVFHENSVWCGNSCRPPS